MMWKTLFFACIAIVAPATQPDQLFKVPLPHRSEFVRSNGYVDGPNFLKSLNHTLKKYHSQNLMRTYHRQGLGKRLSKEPLMDQNFSSFDMFYYGEATIGSDRPQQFLIDFDTGSSDIILPGPKCDANAGCPGPTRYDEGGVDQNRTTTVTYGDGAVSGEDYVDDITIAGLTSSGQGLISLTRAEGLDQPNMGGLVGMAFSEIAKSGFTTFFENLIAQNKVAVKEFAFYLGRVASNTSARSELTLGGRDRSKFTGRLTRVPVTRRGFWQVALDSVKVKGKSAGDVTRGQALIDTGSTLILAPVAAAQAIHKQIPGSYPFSMIPGAPSDHPPFGFAYPCNTKAEYIPALEFAGRSFAIAQSDFSCGEMSYIFAAKVANDKLLKSIASPLYRPMCIGAIVGADLTMDPSENTTFYVIGDAFLKNWYSIYNYDSGFGKPSVSFAKSVDS